MKLLRPAITLNLFFILVCGLAFPAAVTGIAQAVFPRQANGSLVTQDGKVVGSELIGQNFAKPEYFHPRPSAAGGGYDAANSSGTNLGPTSDKLINGVPDDPKTKADESFDGMKQLAEKYRKENGLAANAILPADAVTRSASGLDPHISPRNAELQAARVARARKMDVEKVKALIAESTDKPFAGVFGDPAVNVLRLNRALDGAK